MKAKLHHLESVSRLAILAAIALSVNGCGSLRHRQTSPEATVRAFAVALGEKDYKRAYGLMSAGYRERVSYREFVRLLKENPQETMAASNALTRISEPSEQSATVAYGDDEELRLVRDGPKWRIATDIVNYYDQSTPRAALRTFIRAMERKRYDVMMRLVPSADKEGITPERMREAWSGEGREEVERLLSNLRNHIDNPIEQVGDHATMPYGGRLRVQFVREDGAWKIVDPE